MKFWITRLSRMRCSGRNRRSRNIVVLRYFILLHFLISAVILYTYCEPVKELSVD